MTKFILALCALLFAVPAQAATYRYTSAEFDTFGTGSGTDYVCAKSVGYTCKEDFGVGARLYAEFTLHGPLPADSSFEVIATKNSPAGVWSSLRSPLSFYTSSITVFTDSLGVVIGAYVTARSEWASQDHQSASGDMHQAQATYAYEFAYDCGFIGGYCNDIDYRTASASGPGTIEIISPVPLPASGSVLLAGLGVLVLRRRFQRAA